MQKMLIADDDARMRRVIRELVAGLDMTICEAVNGAEAVELYLIERPDWVLMDLRMKPVDGLIATTQIKAHSPEAWVLIVSQYDDPELREAAARAGACGYVLKENLHELPGILTGMPSGTLAARASVAESGTSRPR
jgi:CheY-like chemotaxis protein